MSLRPQAIRADTLDLQDTEAPSAKDHTNQPTAHPNPLGNGPAAPHQEAELQHAAHDRQIEEYQLVDAYSNNHYDYDESRDASTTDIRSRAGTPYGHGPHGAADSGIGSPEEQDEDDMEDELMDDKMSSSASIDEDNINFDYVYALHTFIATVEGQANATKGDSMSLLDDSNSYWWLVRILKDNSIGYLPAEHIETPTERLARLNKHKNIDLSATMLGDTAEKSKNPLKKAMRRRNAKTVTFNPPTYFEAADIDWSDEEREAESGGAPGVIGSGEARRNGGQLDRSGAARTNGAGGALDGQSNGPMAATGPRIAANETNGGNAGPIRARNIEIRHTDSFLNDTKTEPIKKSLTPELLKEDPNGSARSSESSQNGVTQDMFDNLRPVSPASDRARKDARLKEKKPGMLSGLFKRKEKKGKADEVTGTTPVKQEEPSSPVQAPSESGRASPLPVSQQQAAPAAKRQVSKLVKNPPPSTATPSASILKQPTQSAEKIVSLRTRASNTNITKPQTSSPIEQSTTAGLERALSPEPQYQRVLSPEPDRNGSGSPEPPRISSPEPQHERIMSPEPPERVLSPEPTLPMGAATVASRNAFTGHTFGSMGPVAPPSMNLPIPAPQNAPPAPPGSSQASKGDLQHSPNGLRSNNPFARPSQSQISTSIAEVAGKDSIDSTVPPSLADSSSTDTQGNSTALPLQTGAPGPQGGADQKLSINTRDAVSSANDPAPSELENNEPLLEWDDEALYDYFDNSASMNDVRDMLLIVQDPTGVVPLPRDHPEMLELGFEEQRKKLDAMERELDGLLQGFLARREGRIL